MTLRKHPYDMAFCTLIEKFYDSVQNGSKNWTFPMDIDQFRTEGWMARIQRRNEEMRINARRIGLIP